MSKFNTSSSFFKRNTTPQINITTKVSQKQLKKNKKNEKNETSNSNTTLSDNDFNKLMEENDNPKSTYTNNAKQVKLSSYLNKITSQSDILMQSVMEENAGDELLARIKYENFSAPQILNTILKKYPDPNNWNWIKEYGDMLSKLLEDNYDEQLLCLLLIQNYSVQTNMPKITYKDKDIYYIKLIFQLMFTQDIIDESVYWKWNELLSMFTDVDDETKNKLCIQTTEFFNILKMTFTDEEYENTDGKNGENNNDENNNSENNNKHVQYKQEYKEETKSDSEQETEYNVPEEQDWNMDDI